MFPSFQYNYYGNLDKYGPRCRDNSCPYIRAVHAGYNARTHANKDRNLFTSSVRNIRYIPGWLVRVTSRIDAKKG